MCKFNLVISRTGIPCLWEEGGGWTKTGSATVIAGSLGERKRAIYVRSHGNLACENHALIPVKERDFVIEVEYGYSHIYGERTHEIHIYRINKIDKEDGTCEVEELTCFPSFLMEAIQAAMEKSNHYHCREPYYIQMNSKEENDSQKIDIDSIDVDWDLIAEDEDEEE